MKMIKISDTVAVNPDSIDAIEVGKGSNKKMTIIHIGSKSYSTSIQPNVLINRIETAVENKWDGFFSG